MMRVYRARISGPNWDAILSPARLAVFGAFIEVLVHVKARYNVDEDDHALMLRQP
jgi:hypothetical protein